jgi:PAS domain S-box-containing protein
MYNDDLRALEAALDEARRQGSDAVRILFEQTPDALFVVWIDPYDKFHFEEFNQTFKRLLRVTTRPARGREPHHILPTGIAEVLTDALRRCHQTDAPTRIELTLPDDHRIQRWEFTLTPVHGFLGRLDRIIAHGQDVTKRARHTDTSNGQLLDCVARTTRDVLYVIDASDKNSLYLNARIQDIVGYRVDEINAMSRADIRAMIHPDDLPRVVAHHRKLDEINPGEVISVEFRVRHADGHYVWLCSKDTVLLSDKQGRGRKIVGCATDTTDQRHALADIKRISKRLLRTQDEERRRIARELHDSTTQHLVAVGIGLARLNMINERDDDVRIDRADIQDILADMRKGVNEAQQEIRTLSYLLHPPALERMGLCQTLRRFVTGFARRTRIHADLTIQDGLVCRSHEIATALMRVAQEALINVYRHADAASVAVRLHVKNKNLVLEIEDDGKGIGRGIIAADDDIDCIGVGIPGMRARVRQFRGELELVSGATGALVRARIPLRTPGLD